MPWLLDNGSDNEEGWEDGADGDANAFFAAQKESDQRDIEFILQFGPLGGRDALTLGYRVKAISLPRARPDGMDPEWYRLDYAGGTCVSYYDDRCHAEMQRRCRTFQWDPAVHGRVRNRFTYSADGLRHAFIGTNFKADHGRVHSPDDLDGIMSWTELPEGKLYRIFGDNDASERDALYPRADFTACSNPLDTAELALDMIEEWPNRGHWFAMNDGANIHVWRIKGERRNADDGAPTSFGPGLRAMD